MKNPHLLLASALALAATSSARAQVSLDFETPGQLAANFRNIGGTTNVNVTQSSNGASNDFVKIDITNNTSAAVLLYDTTPGDTTVGTQSTFAVTAGNPLTASFDFRVGTAANSSVGIIFADATNASNHVLALFNVNNSGATDQFRFFKDGSIATDVVTAGTLVGTATNVATTVGLGSTFSNFSAVLSVSGTTPSISLTVGGQTVNQTFVVGDFNWANTTVNLRVFDTENFFASSGIDIDNFSVTAIPEPSAFAAFAGLGALALVALRRRR